MATIVIVLDWIASKPIPGEFDSGKSGTPCEFRSWPTQGCTIFIQTAARCSPAESILPTKAMSFCLLVALVAAS